MGTQKKRSVLRGCWFVTFTYRRTKDKSDETPCVGPRRRGRALVGLVAPCRPTQKIAQRRRCARVCGSRRGKEGRSPLRYRWGREKGRQRGHRRHDWRRGKGAPAQRHHSAWGSRRRLV